MNYKMRMIIELLDLEDKLIRLEMYLEDKMQNKNFNKKEEYMYNQFNSMKNYKQSLLDRLSYEIGGANETEGHSNK